MMMMLVMERFPELAPLPVRASCMRLCLLVYGKKTNLSLILIIMNIGDDIWRKMSSPIFKMSSPIFMKHEKSGYKLVYNFGDDFAVILSVIWQIFAAVLAFCLLPKKVTCFSISAFSWARIFSYWQCESKNGKWRRGERPACQLQLLIANTITNRPPVSSGSIRPPRSATRKRTCIVSPKYPRALGVDAPLIID